MTSRDSVILTTADPPDAGVSFFLGSRTPAAAALSTTSPPQSGSLLFLNHEWGVERYVPIRKLGEGAFGVVYLAEDRELNRGVALKLPKRPRLTSEQDAIDFLFEARNLARLDHPGIVPVYDLGRAQDGRCYVVSKYIRGEDLGQRLKGRGRLGPKEAAELVRQVASALHHAHEEGLVHRDIKPANILLSELDQPYVADFGLALKTEDVQLASQVAGTRAYMSPEQVTGDVSHLDGRSDIFSLGVVFYELLVGARPFRGKSLAGLLKEICSVTPKLPHRWHRGVPRTLGAICMKCLAKRPADRFQTGKQLADELHRWLTLQESARDKPEAPFGPPPPKRFGIVSAIALGVLVGALAVHWIWSTLQVPLESESKIARSPIPPTTLKTFVRYVPPPVKGEGAPIPIRSSPESSAHVPDVTKRTPRRLNPRNGRGPLGEFDALNPIGKR
jgi:serine/threonine protein kinase